MFKVSRFGLLDLVILISLARFDIFLPHTRSAEDFSEIRSAGVRAVCVVWQLSYGSLSWALAGERYRPHAVRQRCPSTLDLNVRSAIR
jgi:hypothetical protein